MSGPYNINNKVDDSQLDTAATADSVAQRTSDGSINAVNVYASGNVGVGFTNPTKKMEVASNISVRAPSAGSTASPQEMKISFTGVGGDGTTPQEKAYIYSQDNTVNSLASILTFGTRQGGESVVAERMRIDSAGNVGIGTSSPSETLHIFKSSYPIFKIESTSYSGSLGIDTGNGNLVLNNTSNAALVFTANSSERMRINDSGNVGIGTSSPAQLLTLSKASGSFFQSFVGDSTSLVGMLFGTPSDTVDGQVT